ncbi:MAG TPA: hypothetical protein V6C57_06195 [Coleofasciculaceae cyanobacterium]
MAQRLKRWESPRREGRNEKGRGGSARQRQKQKQLKALKQRLQQQNDGIQPEGHNQKREETDCFFPLFLRSCDFKDQAPRSAAYGASRLAKTRIF